MRICGIDEAGRGAWAGAVYAAAVILPDGTIPDSVLLHDSKTLSASQRHHSAAWLWEHAMIGVGIASVEEIDQMNILQATLIAMQRAYDALGNDASKALVDGIQTPKLPCPTQGIVRGDSLYPQIAAASIIAKTLRDASMHALEGLYPAYGFARHKGYGTASHRHALAQHGACSQHRRSFRPIALLYGESKPPYRAAS